MEKQVDLIEKLQDRIDKLSASNDYGVIDLLRETIQEIEQLRNSKRELFEKITEFSFNMSIKDQEVKKLLTEIEQLTVKMHKQKKNYFSPLHDPGYHGWGKGKDE
jgi:hypothetical protein